MEWSWGRRIGAVRRISRPGAFLIAACALALGGCNPDNQAVSVAQPRGASVAFDSLDGLPPGQFQKLVRDLNDEAQARRLAVISREQPSAYRVRGYLAVKVTKRQTTVSWVWDVFDQEEQRALRISGEETAKVRHRDAWAAADDVMLQRIARTSMDQLAAFLTSPDIAPGTVAAGSGGPGGAERPERSVARSRRNIPHFPSAGRSDIAGYGGIPRRGQRRAGATAATPAGRVCGSFRGRDADIGGIEPLTGNSSFRRKLRHNHSSHIAGPCPPCYDHAACGGSEGED